MTMTDQILDNIKPPEGWWKSDSEQRMREVIDTMLEEMDPDTVEEIVDTIMNVTAAEYGN